MSDIDKCILSPPGGPSGPFWGIVKQSGIVVAMQIAEREDAEILSLIKNVIAGDDQSVRFIAQHTDEIAIRSVIMAICQAVNERGID